MSMRKLKVAAALVLLFATAVPAWSQSKQLKIVVPYTPGSGPDIISRLLGEQISRANGATVLVENRPGAGTVIGTEAAARAEPDGSTVLLVANSYVINPSLRKVNYSLASFEPLCNLAATPMVLVVQGTSPWKSVQNLVADAKAQPGKITFASGGPASSLHVAIEVLRLATKIDINYVPYGGTAPAVNALVGGHVQAVWADYPTVVSQLKAGTLRGLVTTSPKRVPDLSDVPTLNETGITKYEAEIFYGLVTPAKTSPADVKQLSDWFSTALKAPEVQPRLAQQGLFPVNSCGAPFGEFLRTITADYERIIREAGIKAN
jgi:tripartite-type tricarboxylate transporter receptor subunit TctC